MSSQPSTALLLSSALSFFLSNMGKRKSSSKPQTGKRGPAPLDTIFTCIFCHNPKSITVKIDKKDMIGHLQCSVCGQRFSVAVNGLSDPIDVYTDWVDACEEAAKAAQQAAARGEGGDDRRARGGSSEPEEDERERAPRKKKDKERREERREAVDSDDE